MSDHKRNAKSDKLLGDLESIRTLLDEDAGDASPESRDSAAPAGPAADDEDVPLLEDVVGVNRTFVSRQQDFDAAAGDSGLDERLFEALLSDEWRESARDMLDEARAAVEQHQAEWTPEHTAQLNDALRTRIDRTVQRWLREVVESRMDELRRELLTAVSEQVRATMEDQFTRSSSSTSEDPDGA
ncbi:MAG: hypothetical protein ACODAC_00890 [Pseudomonadota bacterium]